VLSQRVENWILSFSDKFVTRSNDLKNGRLEEPWGFVSNIGR